MNKLFLLLMILVPLHSAIEAQKIRIHWILHNYPENKKPSAMSAYQTDLEAWPIVKPFKEAIVHSYTLTAGDADLFKNGYHPDFNALESFLSPSRNETLVIILLHKGSNTAYGGTVGDGGLPIVILSDSHESAVLFHEIGHALFQLGDEYEGMLDFPPGQSELGRYENISAAEFHPLWEKIRQLTGDNKIGYYPGALERSPGYAWRPYPECLMKDTRFHLCPVCTFLAVRKLNQLTGLNIHFQTLLK